MNGKVSIQTVTKRIAIVFFFLIVVALFGSYDNVNATAPMLEITKESYNEDKNELFVRVSISPNTSFKQFTMSVEYDSNKIKIIPYISSASTLYNDQRDFCNIEGNPIDKHWTADYNDGRINFTLEELDTATTAVPNVKTFCIIRFKVQGEDKVLEEDLCTEWFKVSEYMIIDGEDNYYDTNDGDSGAVKINTIPKLVSKITASDVVFDKDEYYDGDTINLVSGTAIIEYTNTTNRKTATVDLSTKLDEKGNKININTGPWTAKYGQEGVKLNYKNVDSNQIPVNILDRIEYIKFKDYNPIYEYGDELDKENIKVIYKRVSQTAEEEKSLKELEDDGIITIKGFNSTDGPKQTINQTVNVNFDFTNYKWKNETNTLPLNLTIIDTVQKIGWISEPKKKIYTYKKENLNTENGKIKVIYKSTQYDEVDVTPQMVSEQDDSSFNNTIIGTRNLKVTYNYSENGQVKSKLLNYEITINDYIKEITIATPNKVEYMYGEEPLELNNGKVKIIWASKEDKGIAPEEKNLSDLPLVNDGSTANERLEIIGFNSRIPGGGEQTITLKYYYVENGEPKTKDATYTINIVDPIVDIKLEDDEKEKIKKLYKYGEELNLNNSKLTIVRLSTKEEKINLTNNMIKKYNSQQLGNQMLDIEYQGMKIEKAIEVEVIDYIVNIVIVAPTKIDYIYGEKELDLNNGKIKIVWASKQQNPEEKDFSEIELINSRTITDDKLEILGFNSKIPGGGKQPITIKYYYTENGVQKEKERVYTINIIDPVIDIKLEDEEKEKIKKLYKYGKELELNNSKLTVIRLSGAESRIDLTKDMIKGYNSKKLGTQELDIEYEGMKLEKEIEVEVKDYIKDIVLIKPDKTVYLPGETLDLTGSIVKTLSASGILGDPEAVTMEMISGYKENEMGTQNLTVTYVGFDKNFDVIFTVQTGERRYQCLQSISNIT